MNALFKSAELQKQFQANGFVKIPLLSLTEVNKLLTAYQEVAEAHELINIPYITTSHSNDADLIKQVDKILQKVMAPALDKILDNYKLLFGNFLVKMPRADSETEPHQDITFVDESQYVSANVWVALQDTDESNGCMYFLKSSHKLMPTIRPTHDYRWTYENVKQIIKEKSEIFPAKAGDAFIFNHAVIHGSFANKTNQPRIAAVMAAYNTEAPLVHYYLPDINSNTLQKYSMTKEAYLHFVKLQPPVKGVFIEEVEYRFEQLGEEEFYFMIGDKKEKSVLQKFSEWFNKKQEPVNE